MTTTLDHINIRSHDPEGVRDSLVKLLKLEAGHRPAFSSQGYWLYGDGYPIVHLSKRDNDPGAGTGALDHVAFKDDDRDGLVERLNANGIAFDERIVPGSGVRQIFFLINHDIKVEVDFDPAD
ncbi:MAG: hypothetical protein VW405_16095 [Rhodospirillaceae bacterium]